MNGGTFIVGEPKKRAGVYFRFTSVARERASVGERGVVALPFVLSWGPTKEFIEIESDNDIRKKIGLEPSDPSLLLLREARKRARTVKMYRVNEGQKAEASLGEDVKATARYGGSKGNSITIQVSENVLDDTKKDVTTHIDGRAVHRQTVVTAGELEDNDWVVFSGTGDIDLTAGVTLTGGSDVEPTNLDYIEFMNKAETEHFDTIGLPVDGVNSEELKATFAGFIRRLRDEHGIKVVGVLANFDGDHEGIINVTVGATLPEKQLTPAETVAWVAGACSSASVTQSLTFVEYEGAIGVSPELDNDEIEERLEKGEFLLTFDSRDKTVYVEKDINSFTSFTTEKNEKFSRNKFIRIIDAINNDITRELKRLIKELKDSGRDIPVNEDGQQIIRTFVTIYLNELQDMNAIQNFEPSEDIRISVADEGEGFIIGIGVQDVESAEKFYFDVTVQ